VHERRWLEGSIRGIGPQLRPRKTPQFGVHKRHQLVARLRVAAAIGNPQAFSNAAARSAL